MDDRYYNALLPPVARIAGRRLERFTIWHQFMLSAMRSPIVTGAERFTIPDLLVAVKCCRSSYAAPKSMRPTLLDVWWSFIYQRFPSKFKRDAETFFRWVGIQSSQPKYWRPPSKAGSESHKIDRAPRCLGLVCSLMARGNITRQDAWNTPLGEAQWMEAQIAKIEGAELNFLDDQDLEG